MLGGMFEYFEQLVKEGKLYSRRIVTNFAQPILLAITRIDPGLQQSRCLWLPVCQRVNNDYLYYINNLAAVLLRRQSQ